VWVPVRMRDWVRGGSSGNACERGPWRENERSLENVCERRINHE
jgi:hypothetical protein